MKFIRKRTKLYLFSFLKHDFKASITIFFVALPLCLGIAMASGAPVYSGLIAGIVGGVLVSLISGSQLSVSGPAAGLTAICAAAITDLGAIELLFLATAVAGVIQMLLGIFKLGGFTHLIPSSVIKGMLAAIGLILVSKQIPLVIGYDKPDFWTNELFNILTLNHAFQHIDNLYHSISAGPIAVALSSVVVLYTWKRWVSVKVPYVPTSFITVMAAVFLALAFREVPSLQLSPEQYVTIPSGIFTQMSMPSVNLLTESAGVWKYSLIIAFVASLESLMSIEAIDKLDPQNRITPPNRELVAQGAGNMVSGLLGGLPITSVIVRGSANAEAGARTKTSSIAHGLWILLAILIAIPVLNYIPYCVLAVILLRTGFNLAKPKMFYAVYNQGREQFLPFVVTVLAILITDLLIGVLIGIAYSLYFLIRHTYRAGYTMKEMPEGHTKHFVMELALNVSFLNKKRIRDALDKIPEYSILEVTGSESVYIDHDILEIFQEYKSKARSKHIQLIMKDIPEVKILEIH